MKNWQIKKKKIFLYQFLGVKISPENTVILGQVLKETPHFVPFHWRNKQQSLVRGKRVLVHKPLVSKNRFKIRAHCKSWCTGPIITKLRKIFLFLLSCSSCPCLSFSVYVINRFLTNLVTKENLTYFKLVINHLWTLPQKYITFFLSHFEKRRGISYPFLDALIKVKSFAGKSRLTYKV